MALTSFFLSSLCFLGLSNAFYHRPSPNKPGECPGPFPIANRGAGHPYDKCENDYDCPGARKCCSTGIGNRYCAHPVKFEKRGQCPFQPGPGPCVDYCSGDRDCPGNQKCCSIGCGHACQDPVIEKKPGQCRPPGGGPCVEECSSDSDCRGKDKCCFNGCGRTCQRPLSVYAPYRPGRY